MRPQVAEGRATVPRTGLVRIGAGLLIGTMAYILPYSAASTVLLPARIADLVPRAQGRAARRAHRPRRRSPALVANVVFGALSDRTRTRFGARTPWIVGGAVVTALLMVPISRAGTLRRAARLVVPRRPRALNATRRRAVGDPPRPRAGRPAGDRLGGHRRGRSCSAARWAR